MGMCQLICAQNDSIHRLEEVIILTDVKLKNFSDSQSVSKITDSVIMKSKPSLTSLLNYNSVIYFKENGQGMASSPSFRGTTAQQTAVIWNGININSQFNGQTDFNIISTKDFNSIAIRAGGGSAIYGSSAIGGSIHLNTDLVFKNQFSNALQLNYGSFDTFCLNYKMQLASKKTSAQISISRNNSHNNYPYLETNKKNENGQYENTSFNFSIGHKFNQNNNLKFYSTVYNSNRHFSGTLVAPSKSKYLDFTIRNLLEYTNYHNQFTSKIRVAFLEENYKYFENFLSSIFSDATAKTCIAKYDLNYKINNKIQVNTVFDFTTTKGFGASIASTTRNIQSATLLLKHTVSSKFLYEINLRKELTNNYKSPFLFSFGTNYKPTKWYILKMNASRNFRIPTFNDLYYQGSGNSDLKPESSYQAEIGHEITYKKLTFSFTNYYIKIQDLLRWSPNSGGNWTPNNVPKAISYGAEILLDYKLITGHNKLNVTTTYAYTISEDEKTKKQLIYVPFHKFTSAVSYSFKKFSAYYQYLYNGKVYTSSDNYYSIPFYLVSNTGIGYTIGKNLKIGIDVLNLFNENYQNVVMRPMPGRNYNFNITLNF